MGQADDNPRPPPPPPPDQQSPLQQPYDSQYHQGDNNHQGVFGRPPPYSYNPPQPTAEKYTYDQAFNLGKPRCNDVWACALLITVFAGYVIVSVFAIGGYISGRSGTGIDHGNTFSLNSNTLVLFAFTLLVAFVFSFAYVWMARLFPRPFIWITGFLNIAWALGTSIFYIYKQQYSAVPLLVFALLTMIAFYTWIPRIPFSALMLRTSIDVSKKHGHVYLVSFLGGIMATALAAWFSVTLVAIYVAYEPSPENPHCGPAGTGCGRSVVVGLVAYVTFTMYWISEWGKNTIHTIVAGVYGSWYFSPHRLPKGATRGAAKRALTYSFGSVSLGSLLVAIIQFLRHICSVTSTPGSGGSTFGGLLAGMFFGLLRLILGLVEWAAHFVNRYAFIHIALYGKGYFDAAKDTWRMVKDRGIDALINDCLIGPVFSFGALFVAFACTCFSYLYLLFTDPAYNRDGGFTPVVMAFSFLIGFQIAHVFTTPLSSGVDTIFVAAGWDPQVLMREHSELYAEMVRVYPRVQEVIHS